jgi:hypothetical protein
MSAQLEALNVMIVVFSQSVNSLQNKQNKYTIKMQSIFLQEIQHLLKTKVSINKVYLIIN